MSQSFREPCAHRRLIYVSFSRVNVHSGGDDHTPDLKETHQWNLLPFTHLSYFRTRSKENLPGPISVEYVFRSCGHYRLHFLGFSLDSLTHHELTNHHKPYTYRTVEQKTFSPNHDCVGSPCKLSSLFWYIICWSG